MAYKYKIELTPNAESNMTEIFDYISSVLCAPSSANELLDEMEKAFERLSDFPFLGSIIGKAYLEFAEYRRYVVKNYSVFYVIEGKSVIVMSVMHQSRSYDNLV